MTMSKLTALAAMAMMMNATDEAGGGSEVAEQTPIVNGREFKYFFKTTKITDSEGKEIGKGRKHPDVKATLPVPGNDLILEYLNSVGEKDENGKPTAAAKAGEMIQDAVADMIFQAGRAQINDWLEKNPEGTFTATNFDLSILNLEYLATLPKGQRGAWAPNDEDLKDFCEDYTMIFVGPDVNYEPKKVKVHCEQFTKGFAKIKSDKVACQKMKDFLQVWASHKDEDSMADFEQTYNWLVARLDKYLAAEEKNFAEAL